MKSIRRVGDRTIVWLEYAETRITLLLVYDPNKEEQALAYGSEYALSYLDRTLPVSMRNILLSAADTFDGRKTSAAGPGEIVEVLRALLPAESSLLVRCTVPRSQCLPRWPGTLRTGPVTPLAEGLWPFDPEMAAMLAGRRRLLKRDWLTPEQQEKDATWLSRHGLLVQSVETADTRGRFALFAAGNAQTLQDAKVAEAALGVSETERESAATWLGEALGYPSCCVTTFQRLARRDDLTLAIELLPTLDTPSSSPLTQWITGPLTLISHTPCSLQCRESMALAKDILLELERERPGFSKQWENLARRIQAVDVEGTNVAFRASGTLGDGIVVEDAVRFLRPHDESISSLVQPAPEFVGRTFQVIQGALVNDGFRAVIVADHRAEL